MAPVWHEGHGRRNGARRRRGGATVAPPPDTLRREVDGEDLTQVAEVRRDLRRLMAGWPATESEDVADVAELLTSELVTNALVHTEGGAVVTATVTDRLRVEVRDAAPRPPVVRGTHLGGTSGRGMVLVHHLADAWGVEHDGPGKCVWFELSGEQAA
ncbi:ATP-binding protein [Streptomyces sp. NPDC059740]|uniref:ATP-binding protein n=1 Tax=Streptomyces sp. NPDC059740 TaxID=3346926 RepID=UPI00365DB95C